MFNRIKSFIVFLLLLPIMPLLGAHKTIAEAKKHLGESVALIPARYKEATSKAEWATKASSTEAEANYGAGVAEAVAAGSRVKGIEKVGDTKYRKGCVDKGAPVIGTRITAALEDYGREFSPILSAMNAAEEAAPARTRDFRTNVNNRLIPVVEAAKRAAGKPV